MSMACNHCKHYACIVGLTAFVNLAAKVAAVQGFQAATLESVFCVVVAMSSGGLYRVALPGRRSRDLFTQTLIESDNEKVRWTDWFATNDVVAPELRGPRFDRSFLAVRAALYGLGVALESTRPAERELSSGCLVRPLQGVCTDVIYTDHLLVFPHTKRVRTASKVGSLLCDKDSHRIDYSIIGMHLSPH